MKTKKEKEIEEKVPETSKQPTSNVRSYFTKEINDQIVGMTTKEMEILMKDLINTRNCIALLKYTSMRTPLLDALLRATNPIKDPHTISWAQGAMAGICDIETYIIDLNAPEPEAENKSKEGESTEIHPEGIIG